MEDAEGSGERGNTHLWEESWDDDDTSEDFSKQLKSVPEISHSSEFQRGGQETNGVFRNELEKVKGNKQ